MNDEKDYIAYETPDLSTSSLKSQETSISDQLKALKLMDEKLTELLHLVRLIYKSL